MSSSSVQVTVSPESRVVVFSGNLLKAPPLNRRGRKKWHERYFLLRANKTIEIHKSRKAAEAQKTPRRVIDLRECISLELGLEYKNLQHILSLGTFKRTFFLGAPSDALMLQWGNVLEKVKNAGDGEIVEVLDIGLRNTRNCNAVHRVKPCDSPRSYTTSPTTPKKIWNKLYQRGASKSSMAISSLGKETQNGGFVKRGSGNIGYTSYYTSPNYRSSSVSNQEAYGREYSNLAELHGKLPQMYGYPRMTDTSIETVDLRERGRFSATSINTSSSGPSPSHTIPFPAGKVPPPSIMLKGWRGGSSETSPKHGSREGSSMCGEEDAPADDRLRRMNSREFVMKEGLLHRSEAFRTCSPKKVASVEGGEVGGVWRERTNESADLIAGQVKADDRRGQGRVLNGGDNPGPLRSTPLKQSRHYRKIELRAEKPLFCGSEEDGGSSDEDIDSILSEATTKSTPGVVPMPFSPSKYFPAVGRDPYQFPTSIPTRLETHGRKRNYSGPPISGRRSGGYGFPAARSRERLEKGERGYMGGSSGMGWAGNVGWGSGNHFDDEVLGHNLPQRPLFLSRAPAPKDVSQRVYSLENLDRHLPDERVNNYCQIAIGERDEDALTGITPHRAGIANSKLSSILSKSHTSFSVHSLDKDIQLPSPNTSSIYDDDISEREEYEGAGQRSDSDRYLSDTFDIQISPPSSPLFEEFDEDFQLPARGSESFLCCSSGGMKSPFEEIITPPLDFNNLHANPNSIANETISEEGEPPASDSDCTGSEAQNSKAMVDRNSTDSYDTGYTSSQGQSPGINERRNLSTVKEFTPDSVENDTASPGSSTKSDETSTPQDTLSELSMSSIRNSQSGCNIRNSQISYTSTDSIRLYVPLVFQKSTKAPNGGRASFKTPLFVLVCLVENSDNLIKELLSVKSAGGYRVVECECEVGKSVVSAGDDFTVETALEDLEFGFSITTSTQKDVYINKAKVREFKFQIDNMFGCSGKPFSCDVEIRHADQITVLPIEIETAE